MSRKPLPEPWRTALERKGIDSIRGLALKAEISPMAASRLVNGLGTSAETVNAVAWFVFDDDVPLVWKLRGATVQDRGRFDLPVEAGLLTDDQRAAVVAVVRAMLAPDVKAALGPQHQAPEGRADLSWDQVDEQTRRERDILQRRGDQAFIREQHRHDQGEAPADDAEETGS